MFSYQKEIQKIEQGVVNEFLRLVGEGHSEKTIADMLEINPRRLNTIKMNNGLITPHMTEQFWIDAFKEAIAKLQAKGNPTTCHKIGSVAGCSGIKAKILMRKRKDIFTEDYGYMPSGKRAFLWSVK